MKKFPVYLGVAAGVVAVVLAIVLLIAQAPAEMNLPADTGTYTSYEYYGGDAYTGMQQASADAARNVKTLAGIVRSGFIALPGLVGASNQGAAAILLCMGLGMIAYFSNKLAEMNARAQYESQLLAQLKALACKPECEASVQQEAPVQAEAPAAVEGDA